MNTFFKGWALRNKYLPALISLLFLSSTANAQHWIDIHNYQKMDGLWGFKVLTTPTDTVNNKQEGSIAYLNHVLYVKSATAWEAYVNGSGTTDTIISITVKNLRLVPKDTAAFTMPVKNGTVTVEPGDGNIYDYYGGYWHCTACGTGSSKFGLDDVTAIGDRAFDANGHDFSIIGATNFTASGNNYNLIEAVNHVLISSMDSGYFLATNDLEIASDKIHSRATTSAYYGVGTSHGWSVTTSAVNLTGGAFSASSLNKVGFIDTTTGKISWGVPSPIQGGTGLTSYTTGDMIWANATNTLTKTGIGTTGQFWSVTGSGTLGWADAATTTVSNVDGSLTISPTSGSIVASINTAHANTWSAAQTFGTNPIISGFSNGSILFATTGGYISEDNSGLFYGGSGKIGLNTTSPVSLLHAKSSGGTAGGVTVEATSSGSYAALNFYNNTGLAAQFFMTGSTFSNPPFVGNEAAFMNYKTNGVTSIGGTEAGSYARIITNSSEKLRVTAAGILAVNTTSPSASALADFTDTARGILIPRMTSAQRDAIANPAPGLLIYQTTDSAFYYYNGVKWAKIGCTGGSGVDACGNSTANVTFDQTLQNNPDIQGDRSSNGLGNDFEWLNYGDYRIESTRFYLDGLETSDFEDSVLAINEQNKVKKVPNGGYLLKDDNGYLKNKGSFTRMGFNKSPDGTFDVLDENLTSELLFNAGVLTVKDNPDSANLLINTTAGAVGSKLIFIGTNAGKFSVGSNNIGVGPSALKNALGSFNYAYGSGSLTNLRGGHNTAFGYRTLQNSHRDYNTAFGDNANKVVFLGYNTALGADAQTASVAYTANLTSSNIGAGTVVISGSQVATYITAASLSVGDTAIFRFTFSTPPTGLDNTYTVTAKVTASNAITMIGEDNFVNQGSGGFDLAVYNKQIWSTAIGAGAYTSRSYEFALPDSAKYLKMQGVSYTLPTSSTNGVLTNTAGVLTWGATGGSSSFTNVSITGTAGSGYVDIDKQTSDPSTPASGHIRIYSDAGAFVYMNDAGIRGKFILPAANKIFTYQNKNYTVAGIDDNVSEFTNDAGYLTTTTSDARYLKIDGTTALTGTWAAGRIITATSLAVTGTGGNGFYELKSQSSAAASPGSGDIRIYSRSGNLAWIKGNDGFERKFSSSLTADRTFSWPDADGTVVFNDNTAALTNKTYNGNTWTAGTGTLTIAAGKTGTINNTLTFSGTDASTLNIGTGGTLGTNAYTSTAYAPIASPTFTGVVTGPSFTINGTAGNGFIYYKNQSSNPATPGTNDVTMYSNAGKLAYKADDGFELKFTRAFTADRNITFDDIAGTIFLKNGGQTVSSGIWQGTKVATAYGGTNISSYTTGDIIYSDATNSLAKLGIGSTNGVLTVIGGIPSWQTTLAGLTLTTPAINGLPTGTGVSAAATASVLAARDANANVSANNFLPGYATTATAAGTTTLAVGDKMLQYFTGTTTQTVVLPVTSTLVLGQRFIVANNSTGLITIQSSGANSIVVAPGGSMVTLTCILTSGTSAASWAYTVSSGIYINTGIQTYSGTDTWDGTAPTTSVSKQYRWVQEGSRVTVTIWLTYSGQGTTNTTVDCTWPADLPLPQEPSGRTATNDVVAFGCGRINVNTSGTAGNTKGGFIIKTGSGTYKLHIESAATNARTADITVTYFVP